MVILGLDHFMEGPGPDGYMLSSLSAAECHCILVAGEHDGKGAITLISACGYPVGSWLATV